jgi:hypothetical protein
VALQARLQTWRVLPGESEGGMGGLAPRRTQRTLPRRAPHFRDSQQGGQLRNSTAHWVGRGGCLGVCLTSLTLDVRGWRDRSAQGRPFVYASIGLCVLENREGVDKGE